MKPPVEHVRVSSKGRDILIKIKRNTGLEHWNEICRIALCRSLANQTPPPKLDRSIDSAIVIEWKIFSGAYQEEIGAMVLFRAQRDGVNVFRKDRLADYFRSHIERGIMSLKNVKSLVQLYKNENTAMII